MTHSETLISEQEYLTASYRPDCDYMNGALEERNLGTFDHGDLQLAIGAWFRARRRQLGLTAATEVRVRVAPSRYRIPDVVVVRLPRADEQVLITPPYICVEVLSPEDSFMKLRARVEDYLAMGIENIWVLDPETRCGWYALAEGYKKAEEDRLVTRDSQVTMPIGELFLEND